MTTNPTPQSPIGNSVMDTRVFKEPRGFLRCVEWFFAIVAFACCCDFATYVEYDVECKHSPTVNIKHQFSYPFQLDHAKNQTATCLNESNSNSNTTKTMQLSGDFSSDAQFFVFTGVVSFLGAMASLVIYVFFSDMYFSESKKAPMIDFCFTVILAVFWLSASAAWANGVINMKFASDPDNWLFDEEGSICQQATDDDGKPQYIYQLVAKCTVKFYGNFKKANVSIIVGFLNFFLWASNLWFLYKETSWFSGSGSQQPQAEQQSA